MTYNEYRAFLSTDQEERFVNLVLPADGDMPALDVRGKRMLDLSLDEVIRVKRFASDLFKTVEF